MSNQNFITTTDEETMHKLINLGYKLVSQQTGRWTFINNASSNFNETAYVKRTNTLTF